MREISSATPLRIGELAAATGLSVKTLRRMADEAVIPTTRTDGGHRRFILDDVQQALARHGDLGPADAVIPLRQPTWESARSLAGLEEHVVWRDAVEQTGLTAELPAFSILRYAFNEMLNNAIDHSGGSTVVVRLWLGPDIVAFSVEDDGEGVFAHMRKGLALDSDLDAIGELSKGKRTTARDRHTGEGIFFTSKMLDLFRLSANGLRWTVDNLRVDRSVGIDERTSGTLVAGRVAASTARTTAEVFRQFTIGEEFARTRPVVRLFDLGLSFVSRSEARRLLDGLDEFTEIDLDFSGVNEVGQAFVDEVFRVWPSQHPGKRINAINMNRAVEFMVRRGLPPISSS